MRKYILYLLMQICYIFIEKSETFDLFLLSYYYIVLSLNSYVFPLILGLLLQLHLQIRWYISCSYLSTFSSISEESRMNSNTSHVLIYPCPRLLYNIHSTFKYISCSYLSWAVWVWCESQPLFKYISCSYLS